MIYFYHELLELPILIKWDTGIHLDCFNSLLKSFWMAQNRQVMDVFVILRLKQIMWIKLSKEFVKVSVEPKDVVMKTDPVFPIRVAFVEGPLHESIELFCEKA